MAPDEEETEQEPLLELDIPGARERDEWVHRRADRLMQGLPGRVGKDRRTEGEVFDRSTLMTLHRLLSQGHLKSIDFPVSTGKEANVFRATTAQGGLAAVKVYRINTATFRHVLQYIHGDERFEGVARDRKSLVHAWAQKEFRNLHRMREAGVPVPEPLRCVNNVLVMEYLGVPAGPWPRLKEAGSLPDARRHWDDLCDDLVKIHKAAGLVHGDLSEYNILVEHADRLGDAEGTDGPSVRCRIIDVGQAVLLNHPMAREFLHRDVDRLVHYFRRHGVEDAHRDAVLGRLGGPAEEGRP